MNADKHGFRKNLKEVAKLKSIDSNFVFTGVNLCLSVDKNS